jgi:hypothetical protein
MFTSCLNELKQETINSSQNQNLESDNKETGAPILNPEDNQIQGLIADSLNWGYIDQSGSNIRGNGNASSVEGTDPNGEYRFGLLSEFLNESVWGENSFFSAFYFNCPNCAYGQSRDPVVISMGNEWGSFTDNPNAAITALEQHQAQVEDDGGTPLRSVLVHIHTFMLEKLQFLKDWEESTGEVKQFHFSPFMVSDGEPTDYISIGQPDQYEYFLSNHQVEISQQIDKILGLKSDPVFGKYILTIRINTSFYNHALSVGEETEGKKTMRFIANYSGGEFEINETVEQAQESAIPWDRLLTQ